jgi:hypothetical protein
MHHAITSQARLQRPPPIIERAASRIVPAAAAAVGAGKSQSRGGKLAQAGKRRMFSYGKDSLKERLLKNTARSRDHGLVILQRVRQ